MSSKISFLDSVANVISKTIKLITIITSILLVLLTTIVFLEVLFRYVFNRPFAFTSELTGTLFPWIVFLTVIEVTSNEEHIGITYFRDKLPSKLQKFVLIIIKFIMIYFSIFMFKSSIELSKVVVMQKLPVMQISKSWLYASMTVAFAGIVVILFYQAILIIFNKYDLKE